MRILSFISAFIIMLVMTTLSSYAYDKHYKVIKHPDAYRYITAISQFDVEKGVVVPVRRARHGDQVFVPKHGWAYCEFTCEFTVQKEYLDFWANQEQQDSLTPGHAFDFLTKGYTKRELEHEERERYGYDDRKRFFFFDD